jgi:hypothetical protein
LEKAIADIPQLIPVDGLSAEPLRFATLSSQWPAGSGAADVVLLASDAVLTVVETKLNRNPEARREVVSQVIEYAAYLTEWSAAEIAERAGSTFKAAVEELVDDAETEDEFRSRLDKNLRDGRLRLLVAVDEVGEQALKLVTFLNANSNFEIYLLQVSAYEDSGVEIFVPTLHGYARKTPVTRITRTWDWGDYQSELGWTPAQIIKAQEELERLRRVADEWITEIRFHGGWISIHCLGKEAFGIAVSKRRGLELWFYATGGPMTPVPSGVTATQNKGTLNLGGSIENLSDDQLRQLCEQSLKHLNLMSANE